MVTINDSAENTWLTGNFGGYYSEGHPDEPTASLVWIGLEYIGGDINLATSWGWVSGEPLTFDPPWYTGLPVDLADPSGGTHVYLHPSTNPQAGTWWNALAHDTNPSDYPRGIIEVPESATLLFLGLGAIMLRKKRRT